MSPCRAQMATRAPRKRRSRAVSNPIPQLPPVTSTAAFFRSIASAPAFFPAEVCLPLLLEHEIGHDLLELLVLVPELSYFAQLAHRIAIVPVAPAVKRGLRDAQP